MLAGGASKTKSSGPRTGMAGAQKSVGFGIATRAEMVISTLGSQTVVADLLDVSRGQPGKWKTGQEKPSPETARLLLDLDHVLARASLIWPNDVAIEWLSGSNSFLDGARPIDVLKLRGSTEVVDALDAAMAGAFS